MKTLLALFIVLLLVPPALAENKETLSALQDRAAEGDMKAQQALGLRYLNGDGVDVNREEGYFWGCLSERCSSLKYACAEAVRVLKLPAHAALQERLDAWRAQKDVELAARAGEGDLKAQFALAARYRDGGDCTTPFAQDGAEAYFWYSLVVARQAAARTRDGTQMIEQAARERDALAKHLPEETRETLRQRVRDWQAQ